MRLSSAVSSSLYTTLEPATQPYSWSPVDPQQNTPPALPSRPAQHTSGPE